MNRLLTKANKKISLGNAASLLIFVSLMGQALGFFRNHLVSTNFAQVDPRLTDAFFAAFMVPDFFFLTIAAGALGVAFVPILSDRLQQNDKKGMWEITNSLLNILSIVMCVVAAVMFIFARSLLHHVVGPKLDPDQLDKATMIMRLICLNPLFFTLSGIITSVQQTYGRFFFYAVAPLFYNLSIIMSVYIFKTHLGIVGLGVGALIGAILQLLVAALGLFGLGFKYRPKINIKSSDFRQVLRSLPARSVDQGIDSINSIVETNRATILGHGPVTYYNFATTLQNVPVMLFGTAIATAAFPRLTERLSQKRPDLFHKEFFKVLRMMIWIALPVTVVSFFCRAYLARLIYGDVNSKVALLFGYLGLAIFARIMYSIISRYFYAQKDTRTPLFVSLFAIALNIVLVFNLARPSSYGIAGLALAQSIVAVTEVLILVVIMLIKDPYLINGAFWTACGQILSVTGFSVLAGYIMVSLLPLEATDRGFVTLGFKFAAIAGVTLSVHTLMSLLFGLDEPRPFMSKLKNIVLKPIRLYQ